MNLIAAVDKQWGIGRQDRLLFRIPGDMKRFRALTIGKIVVLGRRTLQTFPGGRPLERRTNIVLSRSEGFTAEPAVICHSLAELREMLRNLPSEDVYIIGGASLYRQLLPYCRQAYITKIDHSVAADCFFPNLDELEGWRLISCEPDLAANAQVIGVEEPLELSCQYCLYQQDNPRDLAYEA